MVRRPLGESPARRPYRAYGIELLCDFPLAVATAPADFRVAASIAARIGSRQEVEELWSGGGPLHEVRSVDGAPLAVERGDAGDHLVRHGSDQFHLTPALDRLTCAPAAGPDLTWQHVLLDWVAYIAASLRGAHCLHAGAIQMPAGVVAIAGATGSGKTTLVVELAERGATFFCDDVLALEPRAGRALGHPGPPFVLVERERAARAAGLLPPLALLGGEAWVEVARPANEPAPVAAVVLLDRRQGGPAVPRFAPAGFVDLRSLAVGLPRPGEDQERERFATLAALAAEAPIVRLSAASSVPPAALAAALEARLGPGVSS